MKISTVIKQLASERRVREVKNQALPPFERGRRCCLETMPLVIAQTASFGACTRLLPSREIDRKIDTSACVCPLNVPTLTERRRRTRLACLRAKY